MGWRSWNREMAASKRSQTKLEITWIEILPRTSSVMLPSRFGTLRTREFRDRQVSATSMPSSVSSKPRGPRRHKITPSSASRRFSARLSAGCLRRSARPARLTPPASTISWNVFSRFQSTLREKLGMGRSMVKHL